MKRLLTPAPDDWTGLDHPDALAVNEVDVDGVPHVAVYFNDDKHPMTEKEWAKLVKAHRPTPPSGTSIADVTAAIRECGDISDATKAALVQVLEVIGTGG